MFTRARVEITIPIMTALWLSSQTSLVFCRRKKLSSLSIRCEEERDLQGKKFLSSHQRKFIFGEDGHQGNTTLGAYGNAGGHTRSHIKRGEVSSGCRSCWRISSCICHGVGSASSGGGGGFCAACNRGLWKRLHEVRCSHMEGCKASGRPRLHLVASPDGNTVDPDLHLVCFPQSPWLLQHQQQQKIIERLPCCWTRTCNLRPCSMWQYPQ